MNHKKTHIQALVFERGGLSFAVPLSNVIKVIAAQYITPVATTNQCLLGVINFKGTFVPVVNINSKFGLEDKPLSIEDNFILTNQDGSTLAIIADSVAGIEELDQSSLLCLEEKLPGITKATLSGGHNGIIIIYDANAIFSHQEIAQFTNIA